MEWIKGKLAYLFYFCTLGTNGLKRLWKNMRKCWPIERWKKRVNVYQMKKQEGNFEIMAGINWTKEKKNKGGGEKNGRKKRRGRENILAGYQIWRESRTAPSHVSYLILMSVICVRLGRYERSVMSNIGSQQVRLLALVKTCTKLYMPK